MGKRLLVIGHSMVVDSNRSFWSHMAQNADCQVDLIVPLEWKSNLIKNLSYKANPQTDSHLHQVFALPCFFQGRGSFFFFHPLKFLKVIKANSYDTIILMEESWSLALAQLALTLFLSKNKSQQLVLNVCQNLKKKKLIWLHPWERLINRPVTSIGYCCQEIVEVLQWKRLQKKYLYFPFTYDESLYKNQAPKEVRPTLRPLALGYIGRISQEKGLLTLVHALEKIKEQKSVQELVLHIAGDGPKDYKEQILAYPFVKYHGLLSHQKAHEFYQMIDVLVLPSLTTSFWKEQFGRVIIEAVASGVAVIGSSSGAIPEVMGHLALPWVFKEGDVEDLQKTIENFLQAVNQQKVEAVLKQAMKKNVELFSHQSRSILLAKELNLLGNKA